MLIKSYFQVDVICGKNFVPTKAMLSKFNSKIYQSNSESNVNDDAEEIVTFVKWIKKLIFASYYKAHSDKGTNDSYEKPDSFSNNEDESDKALTNENKHEQMKVHKKSVNREFPCTKEECGKICKSLCSLKAHELRHAGKRPFLCVICGKDFVTRSSLTCHEKIHLDKKGYICKLCNMEFSVRSNLRTHEKKYHEGVKFYCSQCTRHFLNKCSLQRHEKTHTGIRDFNCSLCKAAFYTNKELVKHRKYHEGLRQYKCEQCFKTFFERHHLLIHTRIHSGEKPYVCNILDCEKSYRESQKLKKHQKTKHKNTSVK